MATAKTNTVAAKPPVVTPSAAPSASPLRQKKLGRQVPVKKIQHDSPSRIRRTKSEVRKPAFSGSSSEDESDVNTWKQTVVSRPKTLSVRSHSEMDEEKENNKGKESVSGKRRGTKNSLEGRECYCNSKVGCICNKRRLTVVTTPGISQDEIMEKETKLIVLEFLSSLRPDLLTARNSVNDSSLNASLDDYRNGKKSVKAHTVTIGEQERKEILAHLEKEKSLKKLNRSSSDVSDAQHQLMRKKLQNMQKPIRRWMDQNLKTEIVQFDKENLKKSPRMAKHKVTKRSMSFQKVKRAPAPVKDSKETSLRIAIPRKSMQQIQYNEEDLVTPETFAVNRLEEIGQEIMRDYPDLLAKPISDLLVPLKNKSTISYDIFSSIAKSVFDIELARMDTTVWSRVALTLYMVKETMFLGNLNDTQLELMVDYSTRFFTDNAKDEVELEGGWDSLDDSLFAGTGYEMWSSTDDEHESPEDRERRHSRKISRQRLYQNYSFREKVTQRVYEWAPLGMAAMLVGLGIAFSYVKT